MCTQVWKSTSFSDIRLVLYFICWDVASLTCIVRCSQMYCCRFTLDESVCGLITFTLERETQHKFTLTPLPVHWCVSSIIACLLHIAYVYYRHMGRMTSCKWRESLLESLRKWRWCSTISSPPCCLECYAQGWQLLQLSGRKAALLNMYSDDKAKTCTVSNKKLGSGKKLPKACPEDARYGTFTIPMQETGSTK